MTFFRTLIRPSRDDTRICRIYSAVHDTNLAAWEEDVAEKLANICLHFGDPGDCKLVGEAKWLYMRFTKSNRAIIKEFEFEGAEKITMIRVHRNNTPRKKQ